MPLDVAHRLPGHTPRYPTLRPRCQFRLVSLPCSAYTDEEPAPQPIRPLNAERRRLHGDFDVRSGRGARQSAYGADKPEVTNGVRSPRGTGLRQAAARSVSVSKALIAISAAEALIPYRVHPLHRAFA